MKRSTLGSLAAILLTALVPAAALALPGQSLTQMLAWAKANPALHGVKEQMNQMTAMPLVTASFDARGMKGTFSADADDADKITGESIAIDSASDSYDILKHPADAAALVETVYGSSVARDFESAAKVGSWTLYGQTHQTTILRGKLYGYESSFHFVRLLPLSGLGAAVKEVQACVKQECGD